MINDSNIIIDPISGRAMLGKNSLQDRKSCDFKGNRVRKFLKDKRMLT